MKHTLIITTAIFCGVRLVTASGDAETLAEKIRLAQDVDSGLLQLESKLIAEAWDGTSLDSGLIAYLTRTGNL